jgi:hypothetical protein
VTCAAGGVIDDRAGNVDELAVGVARVGAQHLERGLRVDRVTLHERRDERKPIRPLIRALERLGLSWDVVRVSPERQQRRVAPSGPRQPGAARPS